MDRQIAGYAGTAHLRRIFHDAHAAGQHASRHRPQGNIRLRQGGIQVNIAGHGSCVQLIEGTAELHALIGAYAAQAAAHAANAVQRYLTGYGA